MWRGIFAGAAESFSDWGRDLAGGDFTERVFWRDGGNGGGWGIGDWTRGELDRSWGPDRTCCETMKEDPNMGIAEAVC